MARPARLSCEFLSIGHSHDVFSSLNIFCNHGGLCDCAGDNITFLWDFGDGTPTVTTSTPFVYHAFTQPACYLVNNTAFNVISRRSSNLTVVCVEDELLNLNINTTVSGSSMPAPFVMTLSSGSDFICHIWTGDSATYT